MSWQKKAAETNQIHVKNLKQDANWRIKDTAELLERSIGSIAEDLLIASWLKDPIKFEEIKDFAYARDVLDYIRQRKKELQIS